MRSPPPLDLPLPPGIGCRSDLCPGIERIVDRGVRHSALERARELEVTGGHRECQSASWSLQVGVVVSTLGD